MDAIRKIESWSAPCERLELSLDRMERNRDMWKQQCANQAQTLASKDAELASREAEMAGLLVVVQQMVDVLGEDHGDADDFESECPSCQLVLAGRAALTKQPTKD